MKYKVLYRKYRPDNFENIIGQDYIITTLKNSIINNNISHAYIFSGPRGTGKTSTAKVFAKAINCLEPINGSPCGKCEFCKNFQENPDIIEMDAASNNGVDDIRTIIDNVKLTPTNGKYKVYIIDEVHMLTTSAFNALLLTLEEPPAHTIFILATTNIESVPITILSRCQRFDFQKIKTNEMVQRLKLISKEEKINIDDEALLEIAYLAEGGMRDALSLLDQLSKNKVPINLELIEEQIKTISLRGVNELIDKIEDNDIKNCLLLLEEYQNRAVDYKNLIKKMIDVCSQRAKKIKETNNIRRLSFNNYKRMILNLADSISKVNISVDPFIILEMILLDFFQIADEKQNFDNDLINENSPIPEKDDNKIDKEKCDKLIAIRVNNCFVNAQKSYLEEAKKIFNDYKLSVELSGKIKSIILDSNLVAASDTNIILTCNNNHNIEIANQMLKDIEDSLKKVSDKEYKLIFISTERWLKEKENYIKNIKEKKAYKYMEDDSEKAIQENPEEKLLNDVFDPSKIEII